MTEGGKLEPTLLYLQGARVISREEGMSMG